QRRELIRPRLCCGDALGGGGFQPGAALLELGNARLRGRYGLAVGDQIITAIAGLHIHLVAQIAQLAYIFQQNDLHGPLPSAFPGESSPVQTFTIHCWRAVRARENSSNYRPLPIATTMPSPSPKPAISNTARPASRYS